MTKQTEVEIVREAEGFMLADINSNDEWMGGETFEEAVNTANNMGFICDAY